MPCSNCSHDRYDHGRYAWFRVNRLKDTFGVLKWVRDWELTKVSEACTMQIGEEEEARRCGCLAYEEVDNARVP